MVLQKALLLALHLDAVELILVAGILNVHEQLVLGRVNGVRLAVEVLLDLHLRIGVLRGWEAAVQLGSDGLLVIMQLGEVLVRPQRAHGHDRVAQIVV